MKIGTLELSHPIIQAPISGYSDLAMRTIAREHGAELTFSGLMLARSVLHPRTWRHGPFHHTPEESPLGGQLVGRTPQIMAHAAAVLQDRGYHVVDLNFACPAPKVLARGRGGALLREPDLAIDIVRAVRPILNLPLTVKLRAGYGPDPQSRENFWHICQGALDAGADALAIHPRTVLQRYTSQADWDLLAQARQRFPNATLIGSGDLFTAHAALHCLQSSGADAVLLARGAIGNPWIFAETRALLACQPLPEPPTLAHLGRTLERHFDLVRQLYNVNKAIGFFRKFCVGYCRRHPQRKPALLALLAADSVQAVQNAVQHFFYATPDLPTTWPPPGRAGK